jgi:hypothetical protein
MAAAAPDVPLSTSGRIRETVQKTSPPSLYVQLHGETTRRLEADEKPLQIQNDYLFQLGFGELWRVQEEGMDSEIGCLIRFYAGKEVACMFMHGFEPWQGSINDSRGLVSLSDTLFLACSHAACASTKLSILEICKV